MRYFPLNLQKPFCRSDIMGFRDVSILLAYVLLAVWVLERKWGAGSLLQA